MMEFYEYIKDLINENTPCVCGGFKTGNINYIVRSISPSGRFALVSPSGLRECFFLLSESGDGYIEYFGEYEGKIWGLINEFVIHDDYSVKEVSWVANEEVIVLYAEFIRDETFDLIVYDIKYSCETTIERGKKEREELP